MDGWVAWGNGRNTQCIDIEYFLPQKGTKVSQKFQNSSQRAIRRGALRLR